MKIAVVGCAHGELEKIYETLRETERRDGIKVDILLCCGDFQSVRNLSDLECMACPPKFRSLQTFYKYYNGEQTAPLTLFIGGNHEATNFLAELPYGGWVAPNIFYMGLAGVVNFGGVRIAAISGIFKGPDYMKGHFEHPPYSGSTMRSAYHIRQLEAFRMKQLKQPVDIVMSHDWPRGVTKYGDYEQLFRFKPYFRAEAERDELGSRPSQEILRVLKPKRWLSAHLHCRFTAVLPHTDGSKTEFLALDKCLPRRHFFEILDVDQDPSQPLELHYDAQWLAILKSTNHLLNTTPSVTYMPGPGSDERYDFHATEEEIVEVKRLFNDDLKIPSNFSPTAPCHNDKMSHSRLTDAILYHNPQTRVFCEKLGITDLNALFASETPPTVVDVEEETSASQGPSHNPDEISLDDADGEQIVDEGDFVIETKGFASGWTAPAYQETNQSRPPMSEEESKPPPPKMFKRIKRNQEIYAAQPELEEDSEDYQRL